MDQLYSVGRHDDDDRSPTSPDTGCWSSPDVSESPSSEVEPRRTQRLQHVADGVGDGPSSDDADACLLKLPAPDEFHIPDIRYADFYRHRHPSLNLPAVTYATPPPPPPPRYPPGYGAVMRPAASTEPCLLMDDGRLPVRCDRGVYTAPAPAEYGNAVCYNGAGVGLCDNSSSATDMLLRQDTVRLFSALQHILHFNK